jgi:hypothetical protein
MHIDQFTISKVQNKLVTNSSLNYRPNQDIVNFINNLKNKIKDEPYDRNIDAVGQSRKYLQKSILKSLLTYHLRNSMHTNSSNVRNSRRKSFCINVYPSQNGKNIFKTNKYVQNSERKLTASIVEHLSNATFNCLRR